MGRGRARGRAHLLPTTYHLPTHYHYYLPTHYLLTHLQAPIFHSTVKTGKHTDPVWEVCWQED